MKTLNAQVACRERPVWFPAGGQDLLGLLTEPLGREAKDVGVILVTGGAFIPSMNRNRLSVHMARRLAQDGFRVFRFDYHGIGESTGAIDGFALYSPFVDDLLAAVRCLAQAGVRRVILVGSCFGARTIMAAADKIDGLAGAVLMSAPLRDFDMGDRLPTRYASEMSFLKLVAKAVRPRTIRNLLMPKSRESQLRSRHVYSRTAVMKARMVFRRLGGGRYLPSSGAGDGLSDLFVRPMRWLIDHAVPVLLLYGKDEDYYREFEEARRGSLRGTFDPLPRTVEFDSVEGVLHGFTTLRVQGEAQARTLDWIRRHSQGR